MSRLTAEQVEATRPEANVWVGASAGTGKTHVLMARVLRMLLTGTPPERILCLTYTKAAAAEMANRITGTLGGWVMMAPKPLAKAISEATGEEPDEAMVERARGLFAAALDVPGGLRIETLHAFCQALLKRFPIEAGLSPHFTVIDERTAEALLGSAIEEVMAGAARSPALGEAFAALATESAETSFRELIHAFVQRRRRILDMIEGHGGPARAIAETYRALGAKRGETPEALIRAGIADAALDRKGLQRLIAAASGGTEAERRKAVRWQTFYQDPAGRERRFEDYFRTFFTEKRAPLKDVLSPSTRASHSGLDEIIAAEVARLQALDERVRLNRVARKTEALIVAGLAVNDVYAAHKRGFGQLDYEDLILESARLLDRKGIAPWVLYKLDGGIDHILVDEAQDTNRVQWQLVAKLSEEFPVGASARGDLIRTVFAVGDSKQSIYRFQGAEPEEFAVARELYRERSAFGQIEFLDQRLTLSFRSSASVLEVVDGVFADGPARAGLAEGSEEIKHRLKREGEAGRVELWEPEIPDPKPERAAGWQLPLVQRFEVTPEAKLARRIAETIAALLEDTAGDERPVRAGDIMVLVRQRTDFIGHLIRQLKARAIPVAGADRMKLHEQLAVQDLLAAARFALLPEDDCALACVLKGPLAGIGDGALETLCCGRKGALWEALRNAARKDKRLGEAAAFLSSLLAEADFRSPFEFFSSILQEKGGRKKLNRRLGREVNDPVDEFLSLCLAFEAANPPSLQGFLSWFAESETEIKRDLERGADEVRIMTIHGAKGLQAPVVFLPDTCRKPGERAGALLEIEEPSTGRALLVWAGAKENALGPCRAAKEAALRREREELNRLLYVALTRAEDRLYIGGATDRLGRAVPEDAWYPLIRAAMERLGAKQKDAVGRDILVLENPGLPAKEREALRSASEDVALPPWAGRAARPEKARARTLKSSAALAGEEAASAAQVRAMRRGEIIHKLLELLPDIPVDAQKATALRFLKQPAFRLPAKEQTRIWARVARLLSHPKFKALFGPGSRAEAAIAGSLEGAAVAGQVDRLAVGAKEVWIADYKTNRAAPKSLAAVPEAYVRQLALYAALVKGIYPEKKVRAALVWVEDATLMEIPAKRLSRPRP
jgi:ATP-dependent helicase/nuclease subunit A